MAYQVVDIILFIGGKKTVQPITAFQNQSFGILLSTFTIYRVIEHGRNFKLFVSCYLDTREL